MEDTEIKKIEEEVKAIVPNELALLWNKSPHPGHDHIWRPVSAALVDGNTVVGFECMACGLPREEKFEGDHVYHWEERSIEYGEAFATAACHCPKCGYGWIYNVSARVLEAETPQEKIKELWHAGSYAQGYKHGYEMKEAEIE